MTDISPQIRAAIISDSVIAPLLAVWHGAPSVFTRDPIPADSTFPLIMVPHDASYGNQDGLTSFRDVIVRDIIVYGRVNPPGSVDDHTRIVEQIGYRLRKIFHRKNDTLANTDYHVISIDAVGPHVAPTDGTSTVARVVTLTVRIQ